MEDNLPVPADWEREVAYQMRKTREFGLTPYREKVLWQRRFWFALVYGVLISVLLVLVLHSHLE
jgi:hypothetical protein